MTSRLPLLAACVGALVIAAPAAAILSTPTSTWAQSIRAHGDAEAEAFVQSQSNRVLQILSNPNMGIEAKKQSFRQIINQVADVPRITSFVLGRYRRIVTPAQYAEFSAAFKTYAENVYESRLDEYKGQTLKVTGSTVRQPGDVVVSSEILGGAQPAQVNWRVIRGADGHYRAVDVQVAGIWLAITEQQDFVSTLDNHGGDINLLINQLRNGGGSSGKPG
jgi:phospholipid transport system substrate-binding protein